MKYNYLANIRLKYSKYKTALNTSSCFLTFLVNRCKRFYFNNSLSARGASLIKKFFTFCQPASK